MTLPELAVRRPVATSMALVLVLVFGIIAALKIPLAYMPNYEQKRLHILVDYRNASAKAAERLILKPIEDAVASLNGLRYIYASAGRRGPQVSLNFYPHANIDELKAEVQDRIDRIRDQLPDDIDRIQISSQGRWDDSAEIIMEARIASGRDLSKNYQLLEQKIIRPLQRIPGIAFVDLDGVNPREIRINLDLTALKRHQIDARTVRQILENNNKNYQIGALKDGKHVVLVRAHGAFDNLEAIRNFPLRSDLRLADLADITFREPPLEYGRHLDGEFAVSLKIGKEASANTITVTDAIHEQIRKLELDPALHGINFLVWLDQGDVIKNTIDDLKQTGLSGALLAAIVLFFFLRQIGATLIAVLCIPFSIVSAVGVHWFMGRELDTITLLGLIVGIGMLVDNAVVVIESIDRYQRKGFSNRAAAILGAREVSIAVIAATATSLIVFLPLLFTAPSEFNFQIKYLATILSITLLASLIISQTLIPVAMQTTNHRPPTESRIMLWLERRYKRLLSVSLNYPRSTILIALAIFLTGLFPITRIEYMLDSPPQESYAQINVRFTDPLALEEKAKVLADLEQRFEVLREPHHLDAIYSWWSSGFSIIRLYLKADYQDEKSLRELRKAIPDLLPDLAGVQLSVAGPGRFWQRNRGKRIGFEIIGNDTTALENIAEEAKEKFEDIPGLYNISTSARGNEFELELRLRDEQLASYGLRPFDAANLVDMTFRGRMLTKYIGPDGEVDTRLVLDEQDSATVDTLNQLTVANPDGDKIQIGAVSDLSQVPSLRRIERINKAAKLFIGGSYEDGNREQYMEQMKLVANSIQLPDGYRWDFSPNRGHIQEANREYLLNVALALLLIFAIMASLFESKRQALALMIALPFAFAGAFWCLYLFNVTFDKAASIALLLLLGIVVNNGIVMVAHINSYRHQGMERIAAMLQGGQERLRPIIMTALTTLVGLVPIAIDKPALSGIYYYSMAYVIIGGLLFSTILTTLVLPAALCLVEDFIEASKRRLVSVFQRLVGIKQT